MHFAEKTAPDLNRLVGQLLQIQLRGNDGDLQGAQILSQHSTEI